jgi:hypothetical protein
VAGRRESVRWGSNFYVNWRLYVRDWYLRRQLEPVLPLANREAGSR